MTQPLLRRIRTALDVLRGKIDLDSIIHMMNTSLDMVDEVRRDNHRLNDDLHLARAGIADLKDQLKYGGEAQRKAESDQIAEEQIARMNQDPILNPKENT